MCTVVVRWSPGQPILVLALRDERVGRDFDDPAAWWPDQPGVIGGRDRLAGGTWCASDVAAGVTALVLNRPSRAPAAAGASSRGGLPLLAVQHGQRWSAHMQQPGMAGFALLLAAPAALTQWVWDGSALTKTVLPPGTHMVTSGGGEDGKGTRYLEAFRTAPSAVAWRSLLVGRLPQDDPAALVVRHETPDGVYATVFSQLLLAGPGSLELSFSRTPWLESSWTPLRPQSSPVS